MTLPSNDNLQARVTAENVDHQQRLENLKSALKLAYKTVNAANRRSHQHNKKLYDRKSKSREFTVGDLVYLYNPAVKVGQTKKFSKPWTGPHKITRKISQLNYEIVDQSGKMQVVHVNRLKEARNADLWKPKVSQRPVKKARREPAPRTEEEEEEEAEFEFGSPPLVSPGYPTVGTDHSIPLTQDAQVISPVPLPIDTPTPRHCDPTYLPPESPRSRRELQSTREQPPITRSRAKLLSQDTTDTQASCSNSGLFCKNDV
jgi:hypothetical protein